MGRAAKAPYIGVHRNFLLLLAKNILPYPHMNNCIKCGKGTIRKKFCSSYCGMEFHNSKRKIALGWIKNKPHQDYSCKWCGALLVGQKRKFCTLEHGLLWNEKNNPDFGPQRKRAVKKYGKKNRRIIHQKSTRRKWIKNHGVDSFEEFQKLEIKKEKSCYFCKKIFHSEWKDKRYCSKICLSRSHFISSFKPKKKCRECGNLFNVTIGEAGPKKYCDGCSILVSKRNRRKYNQNIKPMTHAWFKRKLRNVVRLAIKRQGKHHKKLRSTAQLLGCTFDQLKSHLESKFDKRMTWDNYGYYGWHIDHIRPCESFDLSKCEQQEKCFHYTNLQPLWWIENLKKNDKWNGIIIPTRKKISQIH